MNTYSNKFRSLPESLKQLIGLIFITIIIVISFVCDGHFAKNIVLKKSRLTSEGHSHRAFPDTR